MTTPPTKINIESVNTVVLYRNFNKKKLSKDSRNQTSKFSNPLLNFERGAKVLFLMNIKNVKMNTQSYQMHLKGGSFVKKSMIIKSDF